MSKYGSLDDQGSCEVSRRKETAVINAHREMGFSRDHLSDEPIFEMRSNKKKWLNLLKLKGIVVFWW